MLVKFYVSEKKKAGKYMCEHYTEHAVWNGVKQKEPPCTDELILHLTHCWTWCGVRLTNPSHRWCTDLPRDAQLKCWPEFECRVLVPCVLLHFTSPWESGLLLSDPPTVSTLALQLPGLTSKSAFFFPIKGSRNKIFAVSLDFAQALRLSFTLGGL